jgi:hypothetical protein
MDRRSRLTDPPVSMAAHQAFAKHLQSMLGVIGDEGEIA